MSGFSVFCAQNWIRTSTPLRALRPEHSASTNFAIWATDFRVRECKGKEFFELTKFILGVSGMLFV
jgi:hypothetical protein